MTGCTFRVIPIDVTSRDMSVPDLAVSDGFVPPDLSMEPDLAGDLAGAATCNDGIKNGSETATDCGGPMCKRCSAGQMCLAPTDCLSGICEGSCAAGLVAWWAFNEGSGTTASDSSGNAHHGMLLGGPSWTAGKVGTGLQFGGSLTRVSVPHHSQLDLTSGLTISAWVTAATLPAWSGVLMKATDSTWTDGYGLYHRDVAGPMCGYVVSLFYANACATLALDASFHHLVVSYDRTSVRTYLDGSLVQTTPATNAVIANTASLLIGMAAGGYTWDGKIDEVRLFDRALSLAEIQDLFTNP